MGDVRVKRRNLPCKRDVRGVGGPVRERSHSGHTRWHDPMIRDFLRKEQGGRRTWTSPSTTSGAGTSSLDRLSPLSRGVGPPYLLRDLVRHRLGSGQTPEKDNMSPVKLPQ